MSLIERVNDPRNMQLSNTQKVIIALILNAPTPKVAHDRINGLSLVVAAGTLARLGVIQISGFAAQLTELGQEMAVMNNLANDDGSPTEEALALLPTTNVKEDLAMEFLRKLI